MQTTTVESIPYPLATDFAAIPQHIQAMALALDAKFSGWDANFLSITKQPSFLVRSSGAAAATSFNSLRQIPFDTVIWNNAGGTLNASNLYVQAATDTGSWWFLGAWVTASNGGTVTVGSTNKIKLAATYPSVGSTCGPGSPASSVITANPPASVKGAIYGEAAEDNQGGMAVLAVGVMKLFNGASVGVQYAFTDPGAGATRTPGAGCCMWGTRLGNI